MTDCKLKDKNGRAHFMTKRFDRVNGKELHMQILCGIAHYDYRIHRAYSYGQAFDVMRVLRLPYTQAKEMFRRMVFNVVASNQDDPTKHISFHVNENGTWGLPPAYDMGYAYNPNGDWTSDAPNVNQRQIRRHYPQGPPSKILKLLMRFAKDLPTGRPLPPNAEFRRI